jgi:hypothetical protein
MRILTFIALVLLMTADLFSQAGTKLVYQTRYESQDPKFHGPRVGNERTITYRLADRMRTERERADSPGIAFVSIVRCDLRRTYMLDMQNRRYFESPLPTPEEIARKRKEREENVPPAGAPNYIFEIKIVATGETKQAFGHIARHYLKTIKNIPGPEFQQAPQETSLDLWYLDLPAVKCDPEAFSFGPGIHRGVGLVGDVRLVASARPELHQTGEDPTGLLLSSRQSGEETRTTRSGEITKSIYYRINELVECEEVQLDTAMFEVPAGFIKEETP